MKKTISVAFCVMFIALLFASVVVKAQDNTRSISPAFPIGAGEKMLVLPGKNFQNPHGSTTTSVSRYSYNANNFGGTFYYRLELPVGTTLKRIVADVVDKNGGLDISVGLIRIGLDDSTISLRTVSTAGKGTSSSATDTIQLVANPLSHSMLQGYAYYVTWTYPDGGSGGDFGIGSVKVIYEP